MSEMARVQQSSFFQRIDHQHAGQAHGSRQDEEDDGRHAKTVARQGHSSMIVSAPPPFGGSQRTIV